MFFILLFLIILIILVKKSKMQIVIKNLDFSSQRKEKVKSTYEAYLEVIAFNKIKIIKINLKKLRNNKINFNKVLEQAKKIRENGTKEQFAEQLIGVRDLKIDIKELALKVEIGTEDAAVTAIVIGIIASILGIIIKNQKFQIFPIYQDKNILNIQLDCIFTLNLMQYIYKTIKKGRKENERKSSDRRSYAYSNE